MLSFARDADGEVYACLDCGHRRHIRHKPPMSNYPWVRTDEGRSARVGTKVECDRCAQRVWPEGFERYKSTPVFTRATLPAGLLAEHRTRAGVWGKLEVREGTVRLEFGAPLDQSVELSEGSLGLIPPELVHRIVLANEAPVRVQVHFYRAAELVE